MNLVFLCFWLKRRQESASRLGNRGLSYRRFNQERMCPPADNGGFVGVGSWRRPGNEPNQTMGLFHWRPVSEKRR